MQYSEINPLNPLNFHSIIFETRLKAMSSAVDSNDKLEKTRFEVDRANYKID